MAISRIAGQMLQSNLQRDGSNLAIQNFANSTPALLIDVANNRVGVNTSSLTSTLTISGDITSNNITTGNVLPLANVTYNIGAISNRYANIYANNIIADISGNISGNILLPGNNTQVAFNDSGVANTSAGLTFDKTNNLLTVLGNVVANNLLTSGLISATGNVTSGNVITGGQISATANVTGGNLVASNGVVGASLDITNNGNVGGNLTAGNITTGGVVSATGNITGGNLVTNGQLSVGGNLTAANILTNGQVSAAGNITGDNVLTSGLVSAAGNVTSGNVLTSGLVSAVGNVIGGNVVTSNLLSGGSLETIGNALIGGNLIVQGNITYINIEDLQIEDPLIVLGTGANGAPLTVNDGKDRGTQLNYFVTAANVQQSAFMGYDNSAGNMIIATNVTVTNDIVTVQTFGNLVTGNITAESLSTNGNFSAANINTPGSVSAAGNVTGGNVNTAGQISATGNVFGGNVLTSGQMSAAGNVDAGNVNSAGQISSVGNIRGGNLLSQDAVSAVGNITGGNVNTAGMVTAAGNVTGGNLATAGTVTAIGNIAGGNLLTNGLLSVSGNIAGGNVLTSGQMSATGNVTGGNLNTSGDLNTSGNVTGGNVLSTGILSATGNITGGNVETGGLVSAVGNVIGGNLRTSGIISAAGNIVSGANISALNINAFGLVIAAGNISANNISSQNALSAAGNVTGGNLISQALITAVGNVSGGNITTSGQMSAAGNTISGNVVTAGQVSAAGNVIGGNLLTNGVISAAGNITGGNLLTNGAFSVAGNIETGANLIVAGYANITGIVTVLSNVVATNLLTSGLLSAAGNVIGNNVTTNGQMSAAGNVTGGNVITGGLVSATGTVTSQGNVIGGNLTTMGQISSAGNITAGNIQTAGQMSAVGNVAAGNVVTNTVTTAAGDLSLASAGGDITFNGAGNLIMSNRFINDLATPTRSQDAATKEYVDNAVSTGITIHSPVYVETPVALPAATYAQGGQTYTVTDTIAGNTIVFSTAANLQLNDQLWFSSSFSGIIADEAYFVVSTPNTSAAVLSMAYNGLPVANISNASGLSQTVRVNSGVGATLTANANGQLTVDGVQPAANARVLVYNQSSSYQNGVYVVTQTGNVSAPWILTRSSDTNTYAPDDTNRLDAGDYFYVQSGDTGAGESYVMTAPTGPFILGLDGLTFTQFSASQVYSANTAAGLVLNGTVFSAKVDNNITAFDGGGNITVKAGANLVTPNIGNAIGNSLVLAGNGLMQSTTLSAVGNVIGGNIVTAGLISATGDISTAGNVQVAGLASVAGNITAGNIQTSGKILTTNGGELVLNSSAGASEGAQVVLAWRGVTGVTAQANSTWNMDVDSGNNWRVHYQNATGGTGVAITAYSANGDVSLNSNATVGGAATVTGNVIGGNLLTAGLMSATGNIAGGNISTGGMISATGNIIGGAFITAAGDITGANLYTAGAISSTGNVTGAYFIGNGSLLTGIDSSLIQSGNSNVKIDSPDGNVTMNITGTSNVVVVNPGGGDVAGYWTASGNVTAGNVRTGGLVSATGNITGANVFTGGRISASGNIDGANVRAGAVLSAAGNVLGQNIIGIIRPTTGSGTAGIIFPSDPGGGVGDTATIKYYAASGENTVLELAVTNDPDDTIYLNATGGTNVSSALNVSGTASVSGTVTGGNVQTGGIVSAAGNITGGNITSVGTLTGANISATYAVTAGTNVSATGSVQAGQTVSAVGNIIGGNFTTTGIVSATGNITGGNIIANLFDSTNTTLQAPTVGNYAGERVRLYDFANAGKTNYAIGAESNYVWFGVDSNLDSQGFKFYGNTSLAATLTGAGTFSAVGNVTGANLRTGGTASATGNVTGGNINTAGNVVANNLSAYSLTSLGNLSLLTSSSGNVLIDPDGTGMLKIVGTNGFVVPVGNTSQRPSPADTGTLRYNSQVSRLEVYDGTSWSSAGTDVTNQVIVPDGTSTNYTLDKSATAASILVSINGLVQVPGVTYAYTVTGTTITFAEAPLTTDIIDIRFL